MENKEDVIVRLVAFQSVAYLREWIQNIKEFEGYGEEQINEILYKVITEMKARVMVNKYLIKDLKMDKDRDSFEINGDEEKEQDEDEFELF